MTEKLFWNDPYLRKFSANVVEQFSVPDGHAIVLDRTCFYATSGGQPNDLGTLNAVDLKDVRIEGSRLLHVLPEALPNGAVEGEVNWERRFDHMQQHTGQHILSAAFYKLFQAETASFHLGEEFCSIELNQPQLNESRIAQAGDLANEIIFRAEPVTSFFVDPEKAADYPLRKQSDLAESLRIVQIDDFDLSPCSGTHVKNTGEVGMVFIYGHEKLSQSVKITFLCGNRIHSRYKKDLAVLKDLSRNLTTSFDLLPDSINKLQAQLKDLRKENNRFKEESLKAEATQLIKESRDWNGTHLLVRVWNRSYSDLRFLAQKMSENDGAMGVFASTSDNRVIFYKNPAVVFDLKPIFQRFLSESGAKGGGTPHLMEAGGIRETSTLENLLLALF
jgi:alanyl-tRNA synthetase